MTSGDCAAVEISQGRGVKKIVLCDRDYLDVAKKLSEWTSAADEEGLSSPIAILTYKYKRF